VIKDGSANTIYTLIYLLVMLSTLYVTSDASIIFPTSDSVESSSVRITEILKRSSNVPK
jgi:hypothetical protein